MTDITPQNVFGWSEADLDRLADALATRRQRPSRTRLAAGYIADRLKEPTSYAGLAIIAAPLLSRFGVALSDDTWGEVVQLAIGAAGLAAFMLREGRAVPPGEGQ